MGLNALLETGTIIKFLLLFVPLASYILFIADNTLKWKLLLTLGAFIGIAIALMGKTMGKDHSLIGR